MARILVGVTGGIAVYKACTLVRVLVRAGHDVYPVLTERAESFVSAETFFALAQPTLELGQIRGDEDRDAPLDLLLHRQCSFELELEDANLALVGDPFDFHAQRPIAPVPHVVHVLEKLARVDLLIELVVPQEPVLAAVDLAGPLRARGRRDGHLQDRDSLDEPLDQCALARTRRPRDDEDGPPGNARTRQATTGG